MAEEHQRSLDILKKWLVDGNIAWHQPKNFLAPMLDNPHETHAYNPEAVLTATLANTPENRVYHYSPELDALRKDPTLSGKVAFTDDTVGIVPVTRITLSPELVAQLDVTPLVSTDELSILRGRAYDYLNGKQSWRRNGSLQNTTFTPPSDVATVTSVFEKLASVYGPEAIMVESVAFGTSKAVKITVDDSFGRANPGEEPQQPLKQSEPWWQNGRIIPGKDGAPLKMGPSFSELASRTKAVAPAAAPAQAGAAGKTGAGAGGGRKP